ncbi:hypothetical protein MBLNU459_g1887t1 [Dothideomycetes sp. NU459]
MAKRVAEVDGEEFRGHKRPKTQAQPPAVVTDIWSARELQNLVAFSQDAVQQLRNGVQSFKVFLETILYSQSDPNRPAKINILNEYLDIAKSRSERDDADYLTDFMQAWSYAAQTNNDYLQSSVSSILALLLKTIATLVDSRQYGILLCKTLLKHSQLRFISRGIAAPKHKEFIISPCLRILTEIVSFDGGIMAKQLYSKREFTFDSKIMARNLGLLKAGQEEDRRKPSVRSNAIRYLLANFKYQDEGAKIDILKHGHVTKALFDHLKEDPAEALQEIFKVVETNVLRDESIPRSTKSYTMSERSLSGVLNALRAHINMENEKVTEQPSPATASKFLVLAFLKMICTQPALGVLRASGWYPPGSDRHTRDEMEEPDDGVALDLGLDSVDWYNNYQTQVPVRNTILSGFLQTLRPHASEEEREVALSVFVSAPELVADYFFTKADKFSFEPKLTNTWIGYASFLFAAVESPFPPRFGATNGYAGCPPPVSIAVENILPMPLTQKGLVRCLNQSSDLISLFAVRILIVAFQKLQRVLVAFNDAVSAGNELWREASTRLISQFCRRCPPIKDVIALFRKIPDEQLLQKEAVSRLLHLYYQVTPQNALEEKFDVSSALALALSRVETLAPGNELYSFRILELQHLLAIAQSSTGMRWWHKQGSLKFSPFATLLRLCVRTPKGQATRVEFINLLQAVISEHGILQETTQQSPIQALIVSLSDGKQPGWNASDATYAFLDECLNRLVRKPIKYLDDLDALSASLAHTASISTHPDQRKTLSLLAMVCLEQSSFTAKFPPTDSENAMTWIARFLQALHIIGEDVTDLAVSLKAETNTTASAGSGDLIATSHAKPQLAGVGSPILFSDPPIERQTHPGLHRWQQKDVDEALENGDVGDLVLCLSSPDNSIRLQALPAIRKLMVKVQESSNEEKDQIYILLGELAETANSPLLPVPLSQQPVAYIATTFFTHALAVLQDPSHFIYPKLNKYLNKGPSWNIPKLCSHWIDKTVLEVPEEDDKHWDEVEWVLGFLVDGTRTLQDVSLLLNRHTMEKILGLYASPSAPRTLKESVLKLVYRVAAAGGATSLVTRTGILAWLHTRETLGDADAASMAVLKSRIEGGIDPSRVTAWSKGGFLQPGEERTPFAVVVKA